MRQMSHENFNRKRKAAKRKIPTIRNMFLFNISFMFFKGTDNNRASD